ncbi:MAG: T9SS type A sorting domain-containing protein [Calditrichota bacterium]
MYKNLLILNLFLVTLYFQANAQVLVQGQVTSSRYPVKEASVTFMDNADTTIKFSALTDISGNYQIDMPTLIGSKTNNLPVKFELAQNYPNPFSSSTIIPYNIHKQSDIQVTIYDILGREVRKFAIGHQTAGSYNILWDGRNNFGQIVANGIYLCKLQVGGESQVKKMIFNSGGKNFISLPQINLSKIPNTGHEMNKFPVAGNYTVRIENTDTTSPVIISNQFDNIQVNNDTTINFSVDYIPTANIDFDSLRQIIRGFGASNILMWRPDMTDSEIETAFGTGDGQLGFTILRLMIEPNSDNWSRSVTAAKKAYEMGATIIASPWYAPSNMVETVNNVSRVRYDMYEAYAAHLDSFVTYMNNNGVPLYGISVQNEPDITNQWTSWTANEIFTFMKENAHAINGTKAMGPESFHFDRDYSDPILNDSVACANTDIVCGHIYGSGLGVYPLAEKKGKEVWMTEYLINSGNPPSNLSLDTGWAGAIQTAQSINDCMISNMSAYVWWYIVRYYGPIADGTYANKGNVTKKGYVMSQFSRFIRPGDYRVNSSISPSSTTVHITAYRDSLSSKEVIVAINTSSIPKDVVLKIQNLPNNSFTPYTTSELKNVVQGDNIYIDNNSIILNLEASSITTFITN